MKARSSFAPVPHPLPYKSTDARLSVAELDATKGIQGLRSESVTTMRFSLRCGVEYRGAEVAKQSIHANPQ